MSKPAFRVYTVIKRDKKPDGETNDFWLNVGVAFAHEDGSGFNILLQALPLDGKLVMRVYKDEEAEEPKAKAKPGYYKK